MHGGPGAAAVLGLVYGVVAVGGEEVVGADRIEHRALHAVREAAAFGPGDPVATGECLAVHGESGQLAGSRLFHGGQGRRAGYGPEGGAAVGAVQQPVAAGRP
ncbi:hypothetical protein Sfulv_60400 [Streptomyces fulvorobeus]|uniref:Uncharacterized protein n=1 Tax=Streptomyces fulvorobeus TaxID=284028 RepID=A0A7J0CFE8_9ACTN|nr:hypothetical protein Sfulv_60400 [Streptomyces fulvorobeus]